METKKENIYPLEEINKKLSNYFYINNTEITTYLPKDNSEITYSEIAHLYLHLSIEIYNILKSKKIYRKITFLGKSNIKMEEALNEILDVLAIIHDKIPDNKNDRKKNVVKSIFQNKTLLFNSINHYFILMESAEKRLFNIITIIGLSISLFLSTASLIRIFFFS